MSISGIEFGTIVTEHPSGMSADIANVNNADITADLNHLYKLGDLGLFLRVNIENPLPLENSCVDWVFAEHIIEHVSPLAAIQWLAEIRRILRPGGLARIVTPDLAKYVDGYNGGAFFATHREYLERAGLHGMPDRRAFMMNQVFYLWGHKWIYDASELAYAATQAGFAANNIAQCEFGQGQRADVCALDRPLRRDESVYVELTR
ncbi:MAG: methyltransferase domain-containing protein [Gemmatimonadaceae bacterium]|nr:methyltransferase domain-containing protein [Gemmatimonadaceae bacterium]